MQSTHVLLYMHQKLHRDHLMSLGVQSFGMPPRHDFNSILLQWSYLLIGSA